MATVFPDYPRDDAHVPTFRQCLTHMSGLSGHGDWGGVRNPHLENVILNGIDVNEPGKAYAYSGMGFDLAAKAMEIVAGKSALHLYREHLYRPLGMGDVPMENASAGARFTARELGILAQWLANRGSYGAMEFISPQTFERLLPEPLGRRYPGVKEEEGIGMHWMRQPRPGARAGSTRPEDLILGARVARARFALVLHLPRRPRTGARHRPGPEDGRPAIRRVVAEVLPGDRGRRDAVGAIGRGTSYPGRGIFISSPRSPRSPRHSTRRSRAPPARPPPATATTARTGSIAPGSRWRRRSGTRRR